MITKAKVAWHNAQSISSPNEEEFLLPITIGRSHFNTIQLTESPAISKRHLQLQPIGDALILFNNSKNGTLVGSKLVNTSMSIHSGETFQIGPYIFTVSFDDTNDTETT